MAFLLVEVNSFSINIIFIDNLKINAFVVNFCDFSLHITTCT